MKHPLNFLYDYVFPTFILPNALIPEYAILNYMNSQYSTEHTNNCFNDWVGCGQTVSGTVVAI